MRSLVVFVVLMLVAMVAPAQNVVKCTQADGSVAYQTGACSAGATQETMHIDATPVPPRPPERRMVQAFDPATGMPTEALSDVTPVPGGPTYTTREMQQVFDPATGMPREALVDVTRPVPQRRLQPIQPRTRQPTRYESNGNSTYEKAKCRVTHC